MSMNEALRQFVRERANHRCEYCRLLQEVGAVFRFHIEHIRPRQHGGTDDEENLALACPNCNWTKGPNLSAVDPLENSIVPLFNPRKDSWHEHFELQDLHIVGVTTVGRATVQLLRLNTQDRVDVRRQLALRGQLEMGE
jgi:hypothetical protein